MAMLELLASDFDFDNLDEVWDGIDVLNDTELAIESGKVYCICGNPSTDEMLECKGEACEVEWFHIQCVGISDTPGDGWLCDRCRPSFSQPEPRPTKKNTSSSTSKKKTPKWKSTYSLDDANKDAVEIVNIAFDRILKNPMLSLNPDVSREIVAGINTLRESGLSNFAGNLVGNLWEITNKSDEKRTASEGLDSVCKEFHKFRISTNESDFFNLGNFSTMAATFLFQFLSTEVIEEIMKRKLFVETERIGEGSVKLTASEEQTLRYVAGYIPHKLIKFYRRYPNNELANVCVAILQKWAENDKSSKASFLEYSKEWIGIIDRGGLFKINDQVFMFFRRLEEEIKPVLSTDNVGRFRNENLKDVLDEKINTTRIKVAWDKLIGEGNPTIVNMLFKKVTKCYVGLRCRAFIEVYLMLRKKSDSTIATKGEKPLRKKLKST